MPSRKRNGTQRMNIGAGFVIPLIAAAANGYAIFVITKSLAVGYLINPPYEFIPRRRGGAIVLIVLQYLLLLPIIFSWIRFLTTVFTNPGYTKFGQKPSKRRSRRTSRNRRPNSRPSSRASRHSRSRSRERSDGGLEKDQLGLDRFAVRDGLERCPPGLEQFYAKEVFTVGPDGIPRFCNECWNWKPDRTHHCGELGRCIRRFDHYCPWVGGAVSETNNKFFLQITFYATLYSAFLIITLTWAMIQSHLDCKASQFCSGNALLKGHWIGCIVCAGFFGFMAAGIIGRFGWFAFVNRTTIEELGKGNPSYNIAIRIEEAEIPRASQAVGTTAPPTFWVVPYPFRPRTGPAANEPRRDKEYLYAIIQPKSGFNPWYLGRLNNWKSVMGTSIWDWFIPLRNSPYINHDSPISDWPLGKDFEELERAFLPHRYDRKGVRITPLR